MEEEGFPKSQYQWFKNSEEIPDDPKTSLKFFNSSYTLNAGTGTLVSMHGGRGSGGGADILGTQWRRESAVLCGAFLISGFASSFIHEVRRQHRERLCSENRRPTRRSFS